MSRYFIQAAIAAVVYGVMASSALACKCAPQSRADVVGAADIVLNGRVQRVWTQGRKRLASVRVLRVEKGRAPPRIIIETALESAACGVTFRRGDVGDFAIDVDRLRHRVGLCSWTAMQAQ